MNKIVFIILLSLVSLVAHASKDLSDVVIIPEIERAVAPDFVTQNFHGGETSFAEYKGKVVLLHFFATWCIPCREEMTSLENLWQKYKDHNFVVVIVSHRTDTADKVETFIAALNLSYPILLDNEGVVSDKYNVSRVPTSYLIDANGKLISRVVGDREWMSSQADQIVNQLFSENKKSAFIKNKNKKII